LKQLHELKAAVVGTGFIGAVHNVIGDAVSLSNRERRWVEVPA